MDCHENTSYFLAMTNGKRQKQKNISDKTKSAKAKKVVRKTEKTAE